MLTMKILIVGILTLIMAALFVVRRLETLGINVLYCTFLSCWREMIRFKDIVGSLTVLGGKKNEPGI